METNILELLELTKRKEELGIIVRNESEDGALRTRAQGGGYQRAGRMQESEPEKVWQGGIREGNIGSTDLCFL